MLGWSIADDHDLFGLDEMVAAFDVADVNSSPARFDQKKADALNAEHIRMLDVGDFTVRLRDHLDTHGHHIALDEAAFAAAAELVQTRIVVLGDAWELLKFFNDDQYVIDPKAAARARPRRGRGARRGPGRADKCDGLDGTPDRGGP